MQSTVLLVDDHDGFRRWARRVLEDEGLRIVAEAADVAQALDRAQEVQPDIALVDVHLPDGDGFGLAEHLAAFDDPPAVVLTSSHDPAELQPLIARSPARGFVVKDALSRAAIEALLP
ncbi:MAG: response regulator transcription factor [Solirubrobacterales bacterium]|nr:response regulator transcription factor [Solirubrobacterales bacterium]